ncbi:MAG: hypothetical protein P0Y53_24730 [Candidatus Pseudobacter hemicellulosilyticus]|uniref:Uncharacterized protein n=1 Tax=Candidatus Pseudobacter hemicellulosilyticus TaxID=3121375 RepID=A0AAJ6BFI8_9BACT|nr:MAG: hypothetical protein P0Y53_24730 [Pseudobacter sp.]
MKQKKQIISPEYRDRILREALEEGKLARERGKKSKLNKKPFTLTSGGWYSLLDAVKTQDQADFFMKQLIENSK